MAMFSVSVIVPTFNERENMPLLLPRIHSALKDREHEILVVDDRSPDGTGRAVEELAKSIPGLRLVTKDRREGIGAALRVGYGLGRFDVLASTDADLSFDPADIPRLLERIDAGCDLVVGCRHAPGGSYAANSLSVRFKQCVSVAGNFVVRRVTGLGLRDYSANFRAIRREVWNKIQTRDNTNSLLFEMILKVTVLGLRVEEVPVSFVDRIHGRSKLNLWVEAPKFLWKLAYYTVRCRVLAAALLAGLAVPGFCAAHDPPPAETAVMKTASGDPLSGEIAKMTSSGYSVRQRASARVAGAVLHAVVFRETASGKYDRFKVWEVRRGPPRLIYLELSSSMTIDLDPIHREGTLPDLFQDGSSAILYSTVQPAAGGTQSALHVLRYMKGNISPVGRPLPNAFLQDLDGDGRPEIVSRSNPLGQLFAVECDAFRALATTALRTTVFVISGGGLVPASRRFPGFYDSDIARLEGALAANDPRRTEDYGGFLGAALSLYFDYESTGRGREGWARLNGYFRPPAGSVGRARSCFNEIRADIRSRLDIPADWPD